MPVYEYKGILAKTGKQVRGILDADSPRALRESLKRKGIFLTDHAEGKLADKAKAGGSFNREVRLSGLFGQRVRAIEIAVFTRQLATLQKAGIPLVEALGATTDQIEKEGFKRALSDVKRRVNEGSSLANALSEHPKIFSDLYVNMVRAGETSGNLELVLERLTEFLDSSAELRGKVMGALYYPIIMAVIGCGVLSFMFAYVIPKVTSIFEQQQQALPFITRLLIGFADFVTNPWYLLALAVVFGIGIYAFINWKNSEAGKYKWDIVKLRVPVFGKTVRMIAVTRFARTLSTLLHSGVPLLTALDIVKQILGNARLMEVIDEVRNNVREGESMAGPMKRSAEFDPIVTHMIAIGERSGRLEQMLESLAQAYSTQLDIRLRALTSLLEPVMIVVMGGLVGFMVFAIVVPIMKMSQGFV